MATAPQFFEWDHIKEAVDFATNPRDKMITTPEAEAVFELLHDNIPLMSRLRRDLRHTTNRKYVHVMNYLSRMENSTFGIMRNKEVDSLEDTVTNCQNMLREQLRLKSVEVKVDLLRQKHALKDAIDDVTKKFEAVHEDLDKRVNSVAKILNKVKDEPVVVITNAEESSVSFTCFTCFQNYSISLYLTGNEKARG